MKKNNIDAGEAIRSEEAKKTYPMIPRNIDKLSSQIVYGEVGSFKSNKQSTGFEATVAIISRMNSKKSNLAYRHRKILLTEVEQGRCLQPRSPQRCRPTEGPPVSATARALPKRLRTPPKDNIARKVRHNFQTRRLFHFFGATKIW